MANMTIIPGFGVPLSITVNGRTYTSTIGAAPLVVPDFDAFVMMANGWIPTARDGGGTTAQRPTSGLGGGAIKIGHEYYDSTLAANVVWNGKNWIHHSTGATA